MHWESSVLRRLLRAVLLAIRRSGSGGRGGRRIVGVRVWHQQIVALDFHLRPLGRVIVGICDADIV